MLVRFVSILLGFAAITSLSACDPARATWCNTQQWLAGPYESNFKLDKVLRPTKKTLPGRVLARAPLYRISTSSRKVQGCDSLVLSKKLSLYRKPDKRFVFTERQEYYTSGKTLIAVHEQDLTDQLEKSGRYSSSGELPIPHNAPAGKYKVVSKLILKRRGSQRSFRLAQTAKWFRITK